MKLLPDDIPRHRHEYLHYNSLDIAVYDNHRVKSHGRPTECQAFTAQVMFYQFSSPHFQWSHPFQQDSTTFSENHQDGREIIAHQDGVIIEL